jgi:intracellular septation protein A
LYRLGQPLTGALIAIGWSISLLVIKYWRSRSIELFPVLAIPIVLIELFGTLITRNPDFYLASAAIDNVLWGLLFLGSLLYIKSWQRKSRFDAVDKIRHCHTLDQ